MSERMWHLCGEAGRGGESLTYCSVVELSVSQTWRLCRYRTPAFILAGASECLLQGSRRILNFVFFLFGSYCSERHALNRVHPAVGPGPVNVG